MNSTVREKSSKVEEAFNVTMSHLPGLDQEDMTIKTITDIINIICIPVLCAFGLVGNGINVIVLFRYGFRETSIMFLMSLSIADVILTIMAFLQRSIVWIQQLSSSTGLTFGFLARFYLQIPFGMMVSVNVCHILTIAVERVIAVCWPFHASRIFTRRRVQMCIPFIYAVPIILISPMLFFYDITWIYSPVLNITVMAVVETNFLASNKEILVNYSSFIISVLFYTVTIVCILVCCIIVVIKLLLRRMEHDGKIACKKPNDMKATKMLLSVCLLDIVVSLPGVFLYYYVSYVSISAALTELMDAVMHVLVHVHTSANFITYVSVSSKFQSIYRSLFYHPKRCSTTLI